MMRCSAMRPCVLKSSLGSLARLTLMKYDAPGGHAAVYREAGRGLGEVSGLPLTPLSVDLQKSMNTSCDASK